MARPKPDATCPACGEPVILAWTGEVGPSGLVKVALDPEAPVHWLRGEPGDYTTGEAWDAYVEHAATCKGAP